MLFQIYYSSYDGYVWRNYTFRDLISDYFAPPELLKNVVLNCRVDRIDYSAERDDRIEVRCDDGDGERKFYYAHNVIVTVPLSILKRNDIDFVPQLPHRTERLVDSREWWKGFKIFIEFTTNEFYEGVDWFCVEDAYGRFRKDECLGTYPYV